MTLFEQLHARLAGLAATQMFFIGGSPKSGTTWLQLLLDAHPRVVCLGESHVANRLAPSLMDALERHNDLLCLKNRTVFAELPGFPAFTTEDAIYLVAAAMLLGLAKGDVAGALAVGEKTPDNGRRFAVLHALFPQAKFIHVVRDGRDCAVSGWFHNQRNSPGWSGAASRLPGYVDIFARQWAADLAQAAAFESAAPALCLTVRYEDLVADTPGGLRRVLGFLGAAATGDELAACCDAAAFERLSGGRVPGEEDRGSFFRRGVAGDWRRHLDPALAEAFARAAPGWLERFGYA